MNINDHHAKPFCFVKRVGELSRNILFIAACAGGLFAGAAPVAGNEPSAVSAPALFNQGNAEQRAGRLGPAILNYERAQLLAPSDAAIAQNLKAAQDKADLAAPSVPPWQRPAFWLSFNCLAGLASISLLLFCLLFFGTRLIPMTLSGFARGVASMLGVMTLLAASAVAIRWQELDRAVVVSAQPVVHIAPAIHAAAAFAVKPGEIVHVEDTHGDFVRIRAADGRSGWVTSADVEKIIPAA